MYTIILIWLYVYIYIRTFTVYIYTCNMYQTLLPKVTEGQITCWVMWNSKAPTQSTSHEETNGECTVGQQRVAWCSAQGMEHFHHFLYIFLLKFESGAGKWGFKVKKGDATPICVSDSWRGMLGNRNCRVLFNSNCLTYCTGRSCDFKVSPIKIRANRQTHLYLSEDLSLLTVPVVNSTSLTGIFFTEVETHWPPKNPTELSWNWHRLSTWNRWTFLQDLGLPPMRSAVHSLRIWCVWDACPNGGRALGP